MTDRSPSTSAGVQIRHYVFATMRKNGSNSVKIPSSYELAKMFGITRRIARYELEKMVSQGILISKPRQGTFTNPTRCFINVTPTQKEMPLVGVISGDGERFYYGRAENLIYSSIGVSLARHKCYTHYLRFSSTDKTSRIQELRTMGIEGMVWHLPGNETFPSSDFLAQVEENGIPVVAISHQIVKHGHSVLMSSEKAENTLADIFQKEQRRKLLVTSNLSMEIEIMSNIAGKLDPDGIDIKVIAGARRLEDKLNQLHELLDSGYIPDAIACDVLFAEILPQILTERNIDITQQCRIVACNELNNYEDFKGYAITANATKATDTAVDLLFEIIENGSIYTPQTIGVDCCLERKNID